LLINRLVAKPSVSGMQFLRRFAPYNYAKVSFPHLDRDKTLMTQVFDAPKKLSKNFITFLQILVLFSIALAGLSQAKLISPYQTAVLVENTDSQQSFIIKQAFAQILAINTGESLLTILQNPIVDQNTIANGIKRSYFEKIESKYLSSKAPKFWFRVLMDENYIKKSISQAGFSLLPHNRQKIMIWAVKEDTNIPVFDNKNPDLAFQALPKQGPVYAYNDEKLMYWLQQWAAVLGMVIVTPEIDEQDSTQVSEESIKSLAFNAIQQAESHYGIHLNLLIYLQRMEETLKVRTGFQINDQNMSIKHFQEPLEAEEEILFAVMADVSEKYAQHFKIEASDLQKHSVQFVIDGIENYDEVQEIEHYLQNLSMIEDYTIESASQGQLILRVNLSINNQAFLGIIQRDNFLFQSANNSLNQLLFSRVKP